ncbi:MAG: stage V sporulation protein AD [Ruminococcaceae bacterium]|nr:stage V sporulation protein AD [Oscillospiraceae bacterium]
MKNGILKFKRKPKIISSYSVVGHMEKSGPLGELFDEYSNDDKFGKNSWEKAESEMQKRAFSGALNKSGLIDTEIDVLLAGDLLNQCVGSNYGLSCFDVGYLGLYGACSTCSEGLLIGASLYSGGVVDSCAVVTSSHYCSSERQFRFPLEYGGQRTPTAQWTTTGAGAFILKDEGNVEISEGMIGKIIDKGISDINNMGAAMAPAAIDTIKRYFLESEHSPEFFDLIITGDLGYEGSEILKDLLLKDGIDIRNNHIDCGLMLFDRKAQDVHAGGSGCGCSAIVMASDIIPRLASGELKSVLFLGTGALMSPVSLFQGGTIPAIAHLVRLSSLNSHN